MTRNEIGEAIIRYDPPNNLVSLFEESAKKYANNLLFGEKGSSNQYKWVTYAEIKKRVDALRGGLASLNIQKDDAVGIIADNRKEWFIAESATHGLLGRYVPMYEKELTATWKYIIKDAAVKVLFVANMNVYEKVKDFPKDIPNLKHIFIIDADGENSMGALEKVGLSKPATLKIPSPSDIAVLIYTSGTTGEPKGVLLSHGNLSFCSQSGYHIYPALVETSRSLSMLPWAHSYGISAELHNFIQFGGSMGIMGSVETLADDLVAVAPTYLITVPRVFNKIYNGIWAKMKEEGGIKYKLFLAAVDAAKKKRETGKAGFKFNLLDKVVLKKIRAKFGGRLEGAMTASAPMNPDIAQFFIDIGVPTFDCYGMTETSPAITMNSPLKGNRLGSVGQPVEKTKIKIDKSRVGEDSKDGEIVVFGPQVMQGYHNKPDKTAEIMVEENGIKGVRTGDRGWLDDEGYLYITGRFKEEYKLENGKYVHPDNIERDIKLIPWVLNTMIYGDGKAYNVCLVVPDFAVLKKLAEEMDLSVDPKEILSSDMEVGKQLKGLLGLEIQNHLRKTYGGYEIPKRFLFVEQDFSVDNGLLTQTLKLKRQKVYDQYQTQLQQLYR